MEIAELRDPTVKRRFELRTAELNLRTSFAEPAFALFQNLPSLSHHIFSRLTRHGLRLADLKFDRGNGSAAEPQLTCSVLNYSTVVNVRIDSIEINSFNFTTDSQERVGDVAVDVHEAVKLHLPTTTFATYRLNMAAHGLVEGASGAEFIRQFTNPPAQGELGRVTGSGVAFYFDSGESGVSSSLILDVSATVPNGLFIRPFAQWDGEKTPIRSLPKLASSFVPMAFRQVGLSTA